ncbi:MAG: Gfo/Idh/MocA family oxidoreductase [Pirellulales bacterium]|nr:Gfo/Idh/MocA family oxidoreductase [Pirellulales bacterium]
MNRREFLDRTKSTTLGLAAGLAILNNPRSARATPAADKIALAMIGVGGRGNYLAQRFIERGDCRIAYVCDVNRRIAEPRAKRLAEAQEGPPPKVEQDFRRALEDKSVDAAVVATPDHWHCLATVWSCQAGKDVYVEKPLGHSAWEGRKAVEAARKYKRIVQVGTQNRSAPYNFAAKKYIEDGKLGKVHLCRVYNQKQWNNFQPRPDSQPPQGFDWDMYNGPAPESPYNVNYVNQWHHFWRYSGGDIINDGIHQLDLARWLIGVDYPRTVYCVGGRFDSTGAAETPDTQVATFEFDGLLMTFELTLYTPYMLKTSPQTRESLTDYPYWPQNATRIEIYGSQGVMYVGRHGGGWQVFVRTKNEKPVVKAEENGRFPDPEHQENFVRCIRSRELPNADVEQGHRSALLAQYANISMRLGGVKLTVDPQTERFIGNDAATAMLHRTYRRPWVIADEV